MRTMNNRHHKQAISWHLEGERVCGKMKRRAEEGDASTLIYIVVKVGFT